MESENERKNPAKKEGAAAAPSGEHHHHHSGEHSHHHHHHHHHHRSSASDSVELASDGELTIRETTVESSLKLHRRRHHHSQTAPSSQETENGEMDFKQTTVRSPVGSYSPRHHHHHTRPVPTEAGDPDTFRTAETISGPTVQDSRKSIRVSSSHHKEKKLPFPKLHKAYKRFLRKLRLKNWQFLLILGLLVALVAVLIFFLNRPTHEHSFGEWITVAEASCSEQGRQERRCVCGATEEQTLPITHEFVYAGINPEAKTAAESALTACRLCGATAYAQITSGQLGLPIVWLNGIEGNVTKEENIAISFVYEEGDLRIESAAEIHLQGASSASRQKKNYSLHLLDPDGTGHKVQLRESWGKQSKYCLKADYLDSSAVRNLVTASIYGEISASRNLADRYASLVNGGAVDGYPVVVYLNGRFDGTYSLNIPKNKWLFGMKDSSETREAILYARNWSESTALRDEMNDNLAASGWDLEYCSTEDDATIGTDWVRESFNRLIRFVNESSNDRFREGLCEHLNVDRAIDTMLLTLAMGGTDNLSKNILWSTYDGVVWTCTPYDLDTSWGLTYRGKMVSAADLESVLMPPMKTGNHNLLWKRMWECFRPEIAARYAGLRKGILSEAHILSLFTERMALVPDPVKEANRVRWPDEVCPESGDLTLLESFIRDNLAILDSKMR